MKKSELRTGMQVTLRNKETYYVILNTGLAFDQGDVLVHKVGGDTGWMPLCQYDSDMCFHDRPDDILPSSSEDDERLWDIVKVESVREAAYLFMSRHYHTIWERGKQS